MRPITLAAALFLASTWQPAGAEPKAPVDSGPSRPGALLTQNEDAGVAEMRQRLRAEVRYQNGLLVIRERGGLTVAPATIQWTLDCGEGGVGVTFGSGTGETENGTAIQLSTGAVAEDQCQRVAPALAETLLAITKGN